MHATCALWVALSLSHFVSSVTQVGKVRPLDVGPNSASIRTASSRREASRAFAHAVDQFRVRDQPADGYSARRQSAAGTLYSRRGDRIAGLFAAVHESVRFWH